MSLSLIVSMTFLTGEEAGPASGPSSGPAETEGHSTSKGAPPPLLLLKQLVALCICTCIMLPQSS